MEGCLALLGRGRGTGQELGVWEGTQRRSLGHQSLGSVGGSGKLQKASAWANAHAAPAPCPGLQVRVLSAALPPVPQLVCTYHELSFASIRLPGCPPGVDPMVSFPVALSCRCGACRLSSSDCGGPRAQSLACDRPSIPDLFL